VRERRDRDDAVGDPRQEQVRERERPEVIRADLHLEAVRRAPLGQRHDAGVVDEDVERAVPAGGERAHGAEIGEVERAHLGGAGHRRSGGLAACGVAHREHDAGAGTRELARDDRAETAVGAGHDSDAAGHVGEVGGGPSGGGHAQQCSRPRRHFPDRRALLDALAEKGFERLGHELQAAVDGAGGDFDARLQALAHAYVAFATRDAALLELMFAGKRRDGPSARVHLPSARSRSR